MSPTLDTLPTEVLLLITPYLSAKDFLSFCSTTPSLHQNEELLYSPTYWRNLTKSVFRVPNYPVVENNGRRWMFLYRRMQTETKVYGWGNNDKGCLGGETRIRGTMRRGAFPHANVRLLPEPSVVLWPKATRMGNHALLADLQCGGWSNTILDSKGCLYTMGVLDGTSPFSSPSPVPHRLEYPAGFTPPSDRDEPYTAIKQFSSGRAHVLGLSDAGRIWSWDDTHRPGLHVKFLTIDLTEGAEAANFQKRGTVRKVMAGWDRSSAYITGTGIVLWEPSNNAEVQGQSDQSTGDGMLVLEHWVVPKSEYLKKPLRSDRTSANVSGLEEGREVGEVVSWTVLEKFILFVTHLGKLFVSRIPEEWEVSEGQETPHTALLLSNNTNNAGYDIVDVQGSFRSFAVFKRNGEVLTGNQSHLHIKWTSHFLGRYEDAQRPVLWKIPALQNSGVISMAFGDYHYHALHADGTISSYGIENQSCGALGLGGGPFSQERGVKVIGWSGDGEMIKECYTTGRRVHFEDEKREWLKWLKDGRRDFEEAIDRIRDTALDDDVRGQVSEWFEQKLRNWDKTPAAGEPNEDGDDGLPAYFALSVAAAGWHSASLVLVNEEKAEITRRQHQRELKTLYKIEYDASTGVVPDPATIESHYPIKRPWVWVNEPYPRLQLRDGEVQQGEVPITEWLESPPVFKEIEEIPL